MTKKSELLGISLAVRGLLFIVLFVCVELLERGLLLWLHPEPVALLATKQLVGDDSVIAHLRMVEELKNTLTFVSGVVLTLGAIALFGAPVRRFLETRRARRNLSRIGRIETLVFMVALLGLGACRPYDVPEFNEIDTSETGFLIPLEGNTEQQTTFESETYLEKRKVAAKRVQIPHRWVSTGRLPWSGEWIGVVRLVKVDRSPITREWTADSASGTSDVNQAIWIESRDSVGFSVGFNATAYIEEKDTARFLYMYRSRSLADMMDTEVRARIQAVAAEVAARYDLDDLRARKQEIIDDVRSDIIPFFESRGITITTVGMFGGFTYQNASIQNAIDETFVAQQLKVLSDARFRAQAKENERIELAAEAEANRARTIAKGKADSVRMLAEATREAQRDPLFLQLKRLEVEAQRIEKWNGSYPGYLMTFGDGPVSAPQLLVPAPPAE